MNDTYFNEPGFEATHHTPSGKRAALAYNTAAARGTLKHTVLQALRRPTPAFADIIRRLEKPLIGEPILIALAACTHNKDFQRGVLPCRLQCLRLCRSHFKLREKEVCDACHEWLGARNEAALGTHVP